MRKGALLGSTEEPAPAARFLIRDRLALVRELDVEDLLCLALCLAANEDIGKGRLAQDGRSEAMLRVRGKVVFPRLEAVERDACGRAGRRRAQVELREQVGGGGGGGVRSVFDLGRHHGALLRSGRGYGGFSGSRVGTAHVLRRVQRAVGREERVR